MIKSKKCIKPRFMRLTVLTAHYLAVVLSCPSTNSGKGKFLPVNLENRIFFKYALQNFHVQNSNSIA